MNVDRFRSFIDIHSEGKRFYKNEDGERVYSRLTIKNLANRLGIPINFVAREVERLVEEGVLKFERVNVNSKLRSYTNEIIEKIKIRKR